MSSADLLQLQPGMCLPAIIKFCVITIYCLMVYIHAAVLHSTISVMAHNITPLGLQAVLCYSVCYANNKIVVHGDGMQIPRISLDMVPLRPMWQ